MISNVQAAGGTATIQKETQTPAPRSENTPLRAYADSIRISSGEEAKYTALRQLVASLFKAQGIDTKIILGKAIGAETSATETGGVIDFAAITPEEAQSLISEDGYFGVKQTSERIFRFAVGIAGGDVTRIDEIRKGLEQGFAEAKQAFGGWLPDISYQTYDAVVEKLDKWVAEASEVSQA